MQSTRNTKGKEKEKEKNTNGSFKKCLHLIKKKRDDEFSDLLKQYFFIVLSKSKKQKLLAYAIKKNNAFATKLLLDSGVNPDFFVDDGTTPLHQAVLNNNVEIVFALLNYKKIIVNTKNSQGQTALHLAAHNGYIEIAHLLLEANNHLEVKDINGNTPLHLAVSSDQPNMVEALLQRGADINAKNSKGNTPLFLAASNNSIEILHRLVVAGADLNSVNNNNITALSAAILRENIPCMIALLEYKADITLGSPNAINAIKISTKEEIKTLCLPYMEREKINFNYPYFSYHYDEKVLIYYIDKVESLKYRWHKKNEKPCHFISGEDFDEKNGHIPMKFQPNHLIKIYVFAHGNFGSDILVANNGNVEEDTIIHFEKLAQRLANFIGNNNAVVNLISCAAGKGGKEIKDNECANSFAAKLNQALFKQLQRNIPVIAETAFTTIICDDFSRKRYLGRRATTDLHLTEEEADKSRVFKFNQPGSRVRYIIDEEGNQIKLDDYTYKWRANVINAITELQKTTLVKEKKTILITWMDQFKSMDPPDIFEVIKKELNNSNSELKKHSSPCFSPARLFKPQTYKRIMDLQAEGQRIFDSEFTAKFPILTGRRVTM